MNREGKQKKRQRLAASIIAIIIAFIMVFGVVASFIYAPAAVLTGQTFTDSNNIK